jgi:3-phosphoshikimate 1-carboxyvinyltransferase
VDRGGSLRAHPGTLSGRLRVPGDKSTSHRALILGALADGTVRISGLATSEDVAATAAALTSLGASIEEGSDRTEVVVSGAIREATDVIDCGNSGTSLRLLAGVAAGLDALTVLTGDASLRRRPMDRVVEPLRAMGARVDGRGGGRLAPLAVRGGALGGVRHRSPVASAQVKSALLLAGLSADGPTVVESPLRSRDHTERMLRHLGVEVDTEVRDDGREVVRIAPGPVAARDLSVAGDPSSAAFWAVAGAIAASAGGTDEELRIEGVALNPTRTGFLGVLGDLGADVEIAGSLDVSGEPTGDVVVRRRSLSGRAVLSGAGTVDAIDEVPVLAVAGALSAGGLEVRDAAELRVKESDRIAATAGMLTALGCEVRTGADHLVVLGGQRLHGGRVDAAGDHRIAMAAAIAATVADGPVLIDGAAAIATSYPTFLDDLARLGGRFDVTTDADAATVGEPA